jgi:hypothetical protein
LKPKVNGGDGWMVINERKIREKEFTKMEANPTLLQQDYPLYPRRNQQQDRRWLIGSYKPPEALKTVKGNNYIVFRKLKRFNLWLLRSQNTNNKIVSEPMRTEKDNLFKLVLDLRSARRGQQLLIFLSRDLYDPNCSNNNIRCSGYYPFQIPFHQLVLEAKPGLVDSDSQEKNFDSSKIIEKDINFLKMRFDRFKYKKSFDELSKIIITMKIGEVDYGCNSKTKNS